MHAHPCSLSDIIYEGSQLKGFIADFGKKYETARKNRPNLKSKFTFIAKETCQTLNFSEDGN